MKYKKKVTIKRKNKTPISLDSKRFYLEVGTRRLLKLKLLLLVLIFSFKKFMKGLMHSAFTLNV